MGDDEVFVVPLDEVCVYWEEFFEFNHKIMIKVRESPHSIIVTSFLDLIIKL
jgi:hypothetical protein